MNRFIVKNTSQQSCGPSAAILLQGERVHDLKEILSRTADAATLFDPDGIDVRFMNSHVEGNNLRSAAEVENLVGQVKCQPVSATENTLSSAFEYPYSSKIFLPPFIATLNGHANQLQQYLQFCSAFSSAISDALLRMMQPQRCVYRCVSQG